MAKGDEFDVIELIDADAAAFGPSPGRDRAAKERRRPADDQWLLLPAAWVVVPGISRSPSAAGK